VSSSALLASHESSGGGLISLFGGGASKAEMERVQQQLAVLEQQFLAKVRENGQLGMRLDDETERHSRELKALGGALEQERAALEVARDRVSQEQASAQAASQQSEAQLAVARECLAVAEREARLLRTQVDEQREHARAVCARLERRVHALDVRLARKLLFDDTAHRDAHALNLPPTSAAALRREHTLRRDALRLLRQSMQSLSAASASAAARLESGAGAGAGGGRVASLLRQQESAQSSLASLLRDHHLHHQREPGEQVAFSLEQGVRDRLVAAVGRLSTLSAALLQARAQRTDPLERRLLGGWRQVDRALASLSRALEQAATQPSPDVERLLGELLQLRSAYQSLESRLAIGVAAEREQWLAAEHGSEIADARQGEHAQQWLSSLSAALACFGSFAELARSAHGMSLVGRRLAVRGLALSEVHEDAAVEDAHAHASEGALASHRSSHALMREHALTVMRSALTRCAAHVSLADRLREQHRAQLDERDRQLESAHTDLLASRTESQAQARLLTAAHAQLASWRDQLAAKEGQVNALMSQLAQQRSAASRTPVASASDHAADADSSAATRALNRGVHRPERPSMEGGSPSASREEDSSSASTLSTYTVTVLERSGERSSSLRRREDETVREHKQRVYYEQQLRQLEGQVALADGKAVEWHGKAEGALGRLSEALQRIEQLEQSSGGDRAQLRKTQDELEITRTSYEEQIRTLTECILQLNDKIASMDRRM
jgi:Protein phosphatase 1 regulatory subunit 21, C-terminal